MKNAFSAGSLAKSIFHYTLFFYDLLYNLAGLFIFKD